MSSNYDRVPEVYRRIMYWISRSCGYLAASMRIEHCSDSGGLSPTRVAIARANQ
jgi:hypothetical protein